MFIDKFSRQNQYDVKMTILNIVDIQGDMIWRVNGCKSKVGLKFGICNPDTLTLRQPKSI